MRTTNDCVHAEYETARKLVHALVGVGCALLINFLGKPAALLFLVIFLGGLAASAVEKKRRIPGLSHALDKLERPGDRKYLPGLGVLCMVLGAGLAIALFPPEIATAATLIMAAGDSVSHLVGTRIKKLTRSQRIKLVEGTIAGIIVATLAASLIVPWSKALVASTIALLIENQTHSTRVILLNDNVIVPLIAGTVVALAGLL